MFILSLSLSITLMESMFGTATLTALTLNQENLVVFKEFILCLYF